MDLISIPYLLSFVGPFVGLFLVLREGRRRPRWHAVVGAMIGAGLPATIWSAASAIQEVPVVYTLPYVVAAVIYGAVIGVAGVAAKRFGGWLSRPVD